MLIANKITAMKKILSLILLTLGLTLSAQESVSDSLPKCQGLFSIADSVQVRFSPGNLQYQPSTHLWRFAPSQTETLGWSDKSSSPRYKGWIDLFGWGTGMNPTNYSENAADYSFIDWGRYCALPTQGGKLWRTMTMDEWNYLLSKRKHARRLYAIAYVNNQYGLLLLPDGWQCPKGVYVKPGPKEDSANWYTDEKWAKLEAAGAVFLPAEGKRMGTALQGSPHSCHYWTATPSIKKSSEALYLLLDPYFPQGRSALKSTGFSVRLVQEM